MTDLTGLQVISCYGNSIVPCPGKRTRSDPNFGRPSVRHPAQTTISTTLPNQTSIHQQPSRCLVSTSAMSRSVPPQPAYPVHPNALRPCFPRPHSLAVHRAHADILFSPGEQVHRSLRRFLEAPGQAAHPRLGRHRALSHNTTHAHTLACLNPVTGGCADMPEFRVADGWAVRYLQVKTSHAKELPPQSIDW